ncbi:MAG: leucyl aminopeptidase [Crocinitomicaceae bacterium]|nr:leucyl aminopeptidase [Crocinitomicaceae bacterium]
MQIQNTSSFEEYKIKVIVGNKEMFPANLSDQEKSTFDTFLKGEDDFFTIGSFESTTYLIKGKEKAEDNRKSGAKLRAVLKREAKELAVIGDDRLTIDLLEGFLLASYTFEKYKKDKKEYGLETLAVAISEDAKSELVAIQKAVFWARDMVNEPVSFLNAVQLSEEIKALSSDAGFSINVLEKTQIESLKMGGLLAVNQGSIDPPTFSIMEYKSADAKNAKPIVLVGKGVVYDTGGLSLKPTPNSMDIMKSDMGGAAGVAGAIYLAALQQLPIHVIGLIPATDNRPGLNAYAPGDVVTMFNGKTVEVLNTDAEGRMILADALSYSKKFDPELVIDAATLTGSAHRALGAQASISMGTANDAYFDQLAKAGDNCHERVVRFPFWEEYGEEIKSPIADVKNLGGPSAGMITAGKFLEHFVESPYIHIDIAGPAWLDKTDAYRTRGGSGVGVRLLYNFLKNFK